MGKFKSMSKKDKEPDVKIKLDRIFLKLVGLLPADIHTPRTEVPGWDSIRHAELLIALQDEFGFRFTGEEVLQAESYAGLLKVLDARVGSV